MLDMVYFANQEQNFHAYAKELAYHHKIELISDKLELTCETRNICVPDICCKKRDQEVIYDTSNGVPRSMAARKYMRLKTGTSRRSILR